MKQTDIKTITECLHVFSLCGVSAATLEPEPSRSWRRCASAAPGAFADAGIHPGGNSIVTSRFGGSGDE